MEQEQQREQLEKIQSFRLYRETVLDRRRKEQERTKQLIIEQRELFERIQVSKNLITTGQVQVHVQRDILCLGYSLIGIKGKKAKVT